ncbi:MAG: pyridoxamine 5'-phosphate oxidase family protein [Bacillus sp. (in: Bacteria)]|nr:pyridoxamine 5'-phosphate oxidase family protein [Bacillus sp. (in: firmicutes)]
MPHFQSIIQSEIELRELLGNPSDLAKNKVINTLDEECINFLAHSPFLALSTANKNGQCDVSPRGDAPGFVHVVDHQTLLIPERPGNKRADSMMNILENPHVGLQFFIPGLEETLRINGKAQLIRDQEWLEKMAVGDKVPSIAIAVTLEECFIHCAKALRRSKLWSPTTWLDKACLPSPAKMLKDHACVKDLTYEEIVSQLEESYKKNVVLKNHK